MFFLFCSTVDSSYKKIMRVIVDMSSLLDKQQDEIPGIISNGWSSTTY